MPETISFTTIQLASGLSYRNAPEPLTTENTGGPDTIDQRIMVAVLGDGDGLLEVGESGYLLATVKDEEGALARTNLNDDNDPVTVSAHGWARTRLVDTLNLNRSLNYTAENGFEVIGANERPGNSITWTLNDKEGVAQQLDAAQFEVNAEGVTGPVIVAFDFDGDIVESGRYRQGEPSADAVLSLEAEDGDTIKVDFVAREISINGEVMSGPEIDLFFAAYTASPRNTLTIGSAGDDSFSVKDLTLERSDKTVGVNTSPYVVVSQIVADIPEGIALPEPIRVADIQILDDRIGENILSLSGNDATLFEIVDDGLFLRAGVKVDFETNPKLSVFVTVADTSLPDVPVSVEVVLSVLDAVESDDLISFANAQLTGRPSNIVDPVTIDDLDSGTDIRQRAIIAITGDGDDALERGENGYILAGVRDDIGHAKQTWLNDGNDPVTISGHGWVRSATINNLNLNQDLIFDPVTGFQIVSANSQPGDSLTWTLNDKDGVSQQLDFVSFTVNSDSSSVGAQFDFDGNVVLNGLYGNGSLPTADAALSLELNDGDRVSIDFAAGVFAVNGSAIDVGTVAGFFSQFTASDRASITIGGVGQNGFSVGDLVLRRVDATDLLNLPPSAVVLAPVLDAIAETSLTEQTKVADIFVTDDGLGQNLLRVAGPDADLFEIVGTELFFKAGIEVDFETQPYFEVHVEVDDPAFGEPNSAEAISDAIQIAVTDANDVPVVTLANVLAAVPENQDLTTRLKVADIVVTDDVLGTNILALSGEDAALFEIAGFELFLRAGAVLDFESNPVLDLSVDLDDTTIGDLGSIESSATLALAVTDANDVPVVTLANVLAAVPENQDLTTRLKVADIVVTDDVLGTNILALSGEDAALFEIAGFELFLRAGAVLDFESNPVLDLSVDLDDTTIGDLGSIESSATLALAVTDANDVPVVTLANVLAAVPENQDLTTRLKVADIVVTDDVLGTNILALSGEDAALFEIAGFELFLRAGAVLDFESNPVLDLSVDLDDTTIGDLGSIESSATLALAVTDANDVPVVTLANVLAAVPENQDLTTRLKVADIVVTDDVLGTNILALSGEDAALFEIAGFELFLRAGAVLDFESNPVLDLSVDLDDTTIGDLGSIESSATLALAVTDANDVPVVTLANVLAAVPENQDLTTRLKVADIVVTDDVLGTNILALSGEDAALFEIAGFELFLRAGAVLDFESNPVLDLSVDLDDTTIGDLGSIESSATLALAVTDANDVPVVTLANVLAAVPENQDLTTRLKVADIVVTDDVLGTNILALSGEDAALFEIAGFELFLRAGAVLDFESNPVLDLSVDLDDTTIGDLGSIESSATLALAVTDANDVPVVTLANVLAAVPENQDLTTRLKVADIVVTDDVLGTNILALSGEDAALFEIAGFELFLRAGAVLDFESNPVLDLSVDLDDTTIGDLGSIESSATLALAVTDANDVPVVTLANVLAAVPENQDLTTRLKVADIVVTDDVLGTNILALSGEDAALFEIAGFELFLRAGAVLDFESNPVLDLSVDLDDTTIGDLGSIESSATLALAVTDANDVPVVTLANVLAAVPENQDLTTRLKVADIVVTDDVLGTNILALSGEDAALFEIAGFELFLRAGAVLDFESNPVLDLSVDLDDTTIGDLGSIESSATLALAVTDANDVPVVTLANVLAAVPENQDLTTRLKVADIVVTDDVLGTNILALSGEDAALFEIAGFELFLRAGAVLDFESNPVLDLSVDLDDTTIGDLGSIESSATLALAVTDANDVPVVTLANVLAAVPENQDLTTRLKVADIVVTDDVLGTNILALSGEDAALFEIAGFELFLRAGAVLDFESNPVLDLSVDLDDTTIGDLGSIESSATLALAVTDANDVPVVTLANVLAAVPENQDLTTRLKVADIVVTDDVLGTNILALSGEDAALFEIAGFELFLRAGAVLDFESNPVLDLSVDLDDTTIGDLGSIESSATLALAVTDANDVPVVTLANVLAAVPENQDLTTRLKVADIVVTDDVLGTNILALSGEDAALFEIAGFELFLRAGAVLDFESNPVLDLSVDLDDTTIGDLGSIESSATLALAVTDANDVPVVTLANVLAAVPENQDLTTRLKVADIVVTDDVLGTNILALSGEDAALFEIAGFELFLRAGAVLDFESNPVLDLSVDLDDTTIGDLGSIESSATLALAVTDANDVPVVTLANVLAAVPENQDLTTRLKVADIVVTDDVLGTNILALSGEDAALFEIAGFELFLRAGAVLDFESNPVLDLSVDLDDTTIGDLGSIESSATLALAVTDANDVPVVTLANVLAAVPENQDLTTRLKVADIVVTDDVLGTNILALSGEDAALFEIAGFELFLRAGAVLDFESNPVLDLSVDLDDTTIGDLGSIESSATLALAVTDANDVPVVTLANVLAAVPENQDLTTRLKVADIVVTDDVLGTNILALSGEDAALFEIAGFELFLRAGAVLDFESNPVLDLSVDLDDTTIGDLGSIESSATLALAVTDVKETWGIITLDGAISEWPGHTLLASSGGTAFEMRGTYQDNAFIVALSTLDTFIGQNTTFWFNTDRNAATGHQVFGNSVGAEYNVNIDASGAVSLFSGAAGGTFVSDLSYYYNADRTVLEFALPSTLVGGVTTTEIFADVNDTVFLPADFSVGPLIGENLVPTVSLTTVVFDIAENASVQQRTKVADITVTDDGIGINQLQVSGVDSALFEIIGTELFLRAGALLDFETNPQLDINVDVDDTTVGVDGSVEATTGFMLPVTDVQEIWNTIVLDGSTAEWAPNTQLFTTSLDGIDYTVHGTYGASAFLIALEAQTLEIGANTTIWLNTDRDTATGTQVFGAVGAEFNIEFAADGTLALYTGNAGETFVSNLDYFFNAARSVVEIALPSALVDGSTNLEMFADVNNAAFLPAGYSSGGFVVREKPPLLPVDPSVKIAIVYSDASAERYFDKTAYGQLIMAAQNQAMQAGIPFDIITESDLTDIVNIKDYDAIVFPDFSHVPTTLLQNITDTLTSASQDYKIGLIASGNFMTNDETGAAISGNSYARMQSLLGVTLDSSGATSGLTMNAEIITHPVSDGYIANEEVGTYPNVAAYQTFTDVSGSGQTLFTQTTDGGLELDAVIATTTGGRNVHFASDAMIGNNNVLQEAIQWSAQGDMPEVSLQMTRGSSMFFSRNDMDQSQEVFDVIDANPSIYDALLPIVTNWYENYNFVGSYYVNVGANPPDQVTDWNVSGPYYQALMAMENEIGTHSYTHPDDTNLLLPDVITEEIRQQVIVSNAELQALVQNLTLAQINQEMAIALAATDPSSPTAANPWDLPAVQRALLEFSFTFQFDYSRQIIESELGLTNLGAAVPGAPEKIYSSLNIMEHITYLTGGYSGVGAGYPGAFGFIDPQHTDQVYFAPNVSFDFSLIGFLGLTPAEAEAKWAEEYEQITSQGNAPIIHFPWHDYGPTNWDIDDGNGPTYTEAMFTNFIERAYLDGTEFVTGADLAERILAFSNSELFVEENGSNLVVTANGTDLGTFALDMAPGSNIANVGTWYAFDSEKVFLDRDGGVFEISLGAQADDVTRIASLPMRADLISVFGDGSDLEFSFDGRGDVGVELRTLGGSSVVATGADRASLDGTRLTMGFESLGVHSATTDFQTGTVLGTAGNDYIITSDQGRTVDASLGDDMILAGLGADTFVFGPAVGSDTVLGFDLSMDLIVLIGTSFASTTEALLAFAQGTNGAQLEFSSTDVFVLADVLVEDLTTSHLSLGDTFV